MQFLISVIAENEGFATADEMAAITGFNRDQLQAGGHWIFAGGLSSPDLATVIDNRGGKALTSKGPLVKAKEHVAGFWIIEALDQDEALKLATEGSKHCNRKVEVRALLNPPVNK